MHQPRVKVRRLLFLLAVGAVVLSSTEVAEAQCGGSTSQQQEQQDGSGTPSKQNKLAMYKVSLKTYWSRARFPRHYPEWKPPAQFGKLVGRTHDPSYVLYRLGQRLTPGARQYVETGNTDGLDVGVGKPNTLHAFVGPAVPQGEGSSTARAFLDGNHTLISVFARINPSPDWFVGVDSFQLCVESNWVDTVTIELDPLDGGTDNGLTFTAANWPTQPQGIAYRITSRFPAHPAGSFYYPNLPRLPPIATLTFTKLREYTLTETYHEDNVEMEFVNSGNYDYPPTPREIDPNRSLNEAIAEERREMLDNKKYRYWTSSKEPATTQPLLDSKAAIINSIVTSYASQKQQQLLQGSSSTSEPAIRSDPGGSSGSGATAGQKQPAKSWQFYQPSYEALQKARILEDVHRKIINGTAAGASSGVATSSSSSYPGNTIDSWKNATSKPIDYQQIYRAKQQHHRLYTKRKHSKTRPARDCKVSEWGAWSACSRSCGVGETQRTRKILLKPRRGGQPCPPLKKTKWCGSINPCPENNPHLDNLDNHDDLDSPAPHPWWSR